MSMEGGIEPPDGMTMRSSSAAGGPVKSPRTTHTLVRPWGS